MLNIINRINYGYQELEPIILGLMAMNKSFMLIGRHGTGKTRLAKFLSQGYGEKGFVFYDATKDDLISIAGIPDPEAIRNGTMRFVSHERSIWNKSTIVVDEITRAAKENQNLWLEILEERTCFGLPLAYRSLIATANPESYAAAFQLDEALLDRFYAVIPVPEMQGEITEFDVASMIRLAATPTSMLEPEEIARVFSEIQTAHSSLAHDGIPEIISHYLGKLIPALLTTLTEESGPYLSPRTYSRNLPETMMAVAAYYQVAGAEEPLQRAAVDTLKYGIATKLHIRPVILEQIHNSVENILRSKEIPESEKLRLEIKGIHSFEERLDFLQQNWYSIKEMLKADEIEKILGELLRGASNKGDKEKLVALKDVLDKLDYKGDAIRQVDGRLLITLNSAVNFIMPRIAKIQSREVQSKMDTRAFENMKRFQEMINEGTFLSSNSEEVLKLKAYIINLSEGDESDSQEAIISLFGSIHL